ncbi:hypothetical protein [Pantoea sp. SIMBA_079]|uniref:hypothetical protein n=2 Tax=Bacteria TaxID=2 RepID=UPI003992E537
MEKLLSSKALYSFFGLLLIILGAVNVTMGEVASGGACFAVGIILVLLFRFEVKSFRLLGLAAELKDKIQEADVIIEKLRGISLPISEIAVMTGSQAGRFDGAIPRKKLYDNVMAISSELLKMGVPSERVEQIKDSWYFVTAIDMSIPIRQKINVIIHNKFNSLLTINEKVNTGQLALSPDEKKEFEKKFGDIQVDRHEFIEEGEWINPEYRKYPDYFIGIINGLRSLSAEEKKELLSEIEDIISDLNYLIQNKEIRRPEFWFQRP